MVCVTGYCGVCVSVSRQRGLFRVLKAYTQYQPEEGYCQAQGPVAAVLLMNMPAEVAINNGFTPQLNKDIANVPHKHFTNLDFTGEKKPFSYGEPVTFIVPSLG